MDLILYIYFFKRENLIWNEVKGTLFLVVTSKLFSNVTPALFNKGYFNFK